MKGKKGMTGRKGISNLHLFLHHHPLYHKRLTSIVSLADVTAH
jgi:hypothetical protein